MEIETMGRVCTEATIENLADLLNVEQGLCTLDQVRRVTVDNALVDSGATLLALPTRLISQLGLTHKYSRRVNTTAGPREAAVYGTVRLTIQGRECPTDVMEVPDTVPVLIGQIPLEYLDFVIDPRGQKLIGNPEHGGEHIFELY